VSLDPRQEVARSATSDPVARLEAKLAELEKRLDAFRNTALAIPVDGAPTAAAADGTLAVDRTTNRLYARIAGAWRYVAMT
jgi:hypothetical protein